MPAYDSEDRPDPAEQPIRARVPEHVATGAFSTGVIVMTAQSEFILDFVQNLGRPHQIVARVVMPHQVLPQLVDALQRNIELYKNRWGELPQTGMSKPGTSPDGNRNEPSSLEDNPTPPPEAPRPQAAPTKAAQLGASGSSAAGGSVSGAGGPSNAGGGGGMAASGPGLSGDGGQPAGGEAGGSGPMGGSGQTGSGTRQASAQEIYDDLKIRDEFLSGAYANAVMIGHGPHEFSFDFITNFYPHSAVSSRVFLAAGQVPRLYDSLKGTWEQLRTRLQQPPGRQPPPGSDIRPDEDSPFA